MHISNLFLNKLTRLLLSKLLVSLRCFIAVSITVDRFCTQSYAKSNATVMTPTIYGQTRPKIAILSHRQNGIGYNAELHAGSFYYSATPSDFMLLGSFASSFRSMIPTTCLRAAPILLLPILATESHGTTFGLVSSAINCSVAQTLMRAQNKGSFQAQGKNIKLLVT